MELYIDDEEISSCAKVADLESALAAVRALGGKKDLCLQAHEDGPQLVLTILGTGKDEAYCVEHIHRTCVARFIVPVWSVAADCMRRFLAGRLPFTGALTGDGCPLCKPR